MTVPLTLLPKRDTDSENLLRISYQDKELLVNSALVNSEIAAATGIIGFYVYNRQVHQIKNDSTIGLLVQQFLKEQNL